MALRNTFLTTVSTAYWMYYSVMPESQGSLLALALCIFAEE
jgi:hypothetical protein